MTIHNQDLGLAQSACSPPMGPVTQTPAAVFTPCGGGRRDRSTRHNPCLCRKVCGDVWEDEDSPRNSVCKALPRPPAPPLVRVVLVHRDER